MMDIVFTSACGSSRSRSAGFLLALLTALAGACTTATRVSETAEAPDRAPAEAIAEYQEAIRLEPTNAVLWVQLAQVYEQMGRGEDALRSLEMGLDAHPRNAGILNQMGWLYATAAPPIHDPAKALAYAQQAVEASNGSDANILDTLAEAYFANQEFDEAIQTEERALEIAPGDEVLQNQLKKFREAKVAESGG